MKLGFWSPVAGMSGVSSSVIALSVLAARLYELDVILMQTSANPFNGLQRPLIGSPENSDANMFFANIGIDAIRRHITSGDRTAATIADCSVKIEDLKLSLIPGTNHTEEMFEEELLSYADIVSSVLDSHYKISMYDIKAGFSELSKRMLHAMDFIVICLPQSRIAMDILEEHSNFLPQEKSIYYLLNNFDSDSAMTKRLFCKTFHVSKSECGTISHCSDFMDAINNSSVVSFLDRYCEMEDKESSVYNFISDCRTALADILKLSGAVDALEDEEGRI